MVRPLVLWLCIIVAMLFLTSTGFSSETESTQRFSFKLLLSQKKCQIAIWIPTIIFTMPVSELHIRYPSRG